MAIHINDNGEPDLCRVDVSNPRSTGCPFGDSDTHFESMEQAREYYEGWSTPVYDRYAIGDSRVLERLLDNGVDHMRVCMASRQDGNTGCEINVAVPIDIP